MKFSNSGAAAALGSPLLCFAFVIASPIEEIVLSQ